MSTTLLPSVTGGATRSMLAAVAAPALMSH
jgi:hypothetical protein